MLTQAQIDATSLPPPGKKLKLFDGDGLYLLIGATGTRGWRLKFRHQGRESSLSFGPYPDVPIEVARERTRAARDQLRRGENPAQAKREKRESEWTAAMSTFGRVGGEFLRHDDTKAPKTAETHARQYHHLARLHHRPLDAIQTRDIVQICETLEAKGNRETAHRVASFAARVYRYATQKGYTTHNPARDLKGALKP